MNAPFYLALTNEITAEVSTQVGIDLPQYHLAQKIGLDKGYRYIINEKEIVIQDNAPFCNAWHFHRGTYMMGAEDGVSSKFGKGISLRSEFTFVMVFFSHDVFLWNGLKAFAPKKMYSVPVLDSNGNQTETLSGMVKGGKIRDNIYEIAKEWFPDQLPKLQRKQMQMAALEIQYTMEMIGVCNLCINM